MRVISAIFAFSFVLFVSCNNAKTTPENKADTAPAASKPAATSKLNAASTVQLLSVVNSYYNLKNALVASNAGKAEISSKELLGAADSMSMSTVVDSSIMVSIKPYLDTIVMNSRALTEIKDPSCERQRIAFGAISTSLFAILKKSGMKNAGVYQQYCPMAFNEKGAIWLSNENDIKNPYFGKKMLECGEVQDSL